jgi:hypothetical protein
MVASPGLPVTGIGYRWVTWGEGTSDEMCFAFVYATL